MPATHTSTRRFAASGTLLSDAEQFARDVGFYLSQTPRQLPSRYLYDELGSTLFEAICRLPWYGITRTEQHLLREHASDILAHTAPLSTIVELGPGSGDKLATLIAAHAERSLIVHLVDISAAALDAATRALHDHPEIEIVTHEATYEAGLSDFARDARPSGRALVLSLGSNIGNFDPPGVDDFLHVIRSAVNEGDLLLLGTDLVKPESDLLLAYDDPLGVTAAFNRNLLVRVNRELGADFDLDAFAHRVVWNSAASRIEMHLVSAGRQRVRVPASGADITFEPGEMIWTESSYKYRPPEVIAMLDRAGFGVAQQWVKDTFALTLAEAR